MYTFVNFQLNKDANKLVKKGWKPGKGKCCKNIRKTHNGFIWKYKN